MKDKIAMPQQEICKEPNSGKYALNKYAKK